MISAFLFLLSTKNGMDIAVACCFISFLTTLVYYRQKIGWNGYKTLLVCYIVFGIYLEIWGANTFKSGALRSLIYVAFFILTVPTFWINKKLIKYLVILSVFFLFLQAIYQHHFLGIPRIGNHINPIQYATVCSTLSILIFIFIIEESRKKHQIGLILLFAASLVTLIYTQARGPWLAFLVTFFIITILGFRLIKRNFSRTILILGVLSACTVILASGMILEKRFNSIKTELSQYQQKNYDTSIGARLHLWQVAIYSIKRDNFMGLKVHFDDNIEQLSKAGIYQAKIKHKHFHNSYLDRLAKHGALGLFLCLALVLYPSFKSLKSKNTDNIFFLIAITPPCVYLLAGLTDTAFRTEESLFFFIIVNYLPFLLNPDLPDNQLIKYEQFSNVK